MRACTSAPIADDGMGEKRNKKKHTLAVKELVVDPEGVVVPELLVLDVHEHALLQEAELHRAAQQQQQQHDDDGVRPVTRRFFPTNKKKKHTHTHTHFP